MAIGRYLSLEEAREKKKMERFMKEHPSKGDEVVFDDLLDRMAKNLPVDDQTSEQD